MTTSADDAGATPLLSKSDEEQLDLMGILYWVYGGLIGVGGAAFGLFALLPAILLSTAPTTKGGPPPWVVGGVFAIVFGAVALLLVAKGIVMVFVGNALRRRKSYVLCMVGAALAVMNMPLGTALAVFTFVVLNKPETKRRFAYGV